jgi:hypothetical protein
MEAHQLKQIENPKSRIENAPSSSWSSLECSPPCQGGDRGFKSHRGRFDIFDFGFSIFDWAGGLKRVEV